jgi:predicted nucleotidyltransferase
MKDALQERVIPALVTLAKERCSIIVLFGSHAKGSAYDTSDVDIALVPRGTLSWSERLELISQIVALCDDRASVVFISSATDPVLGDEIRKDGKLLYEEKAGIWLELQIKLLHKFIDTAPLRLWSLKSLLSGD